MRPAARIEKTLLHTFLRDNSHRLSPVQKRASQQLLQLQETITNPQISVSSIPLCQLQIRTLENCLLDSALPAEAHELTSFLNLKQAAAQKLINIFSSPETQNESVLQNLYKNLILAAYDLSSTKKLNIYSKEFLEAYYSCIIQTPLAEFIAQPIKREAEVSYLIKKHRVTINHWEMLLTELFSQKQAFCKETTPEGQKLQAFVSAVSRLKTPIENYLDSGPEHEKNIVEINASLDHLDSILKEGDIISLEPEENGLSSSIIQLKKENILNISAKIKTLVAERQTWQSEEQILMEILNLINREKVNEIYACLALQEAHFQSSLKIAQCPGENFYRFVIEVEINNAIYILNPELGMLSQNSLLYHSLPSPFVRRLTTRGESARIRKNVARKNLAAVRERPDLLEIETFYGSEAKIKQRNGLGIHHSTGAVLFNLAGHPISDKAQRTNSDVVAIRKIEEGENKNYPGGCIIIAVADGISSADNEEYSDLAVQEALDPQYLHYTGGQAMQKINLAMANKKPLKPNLSNQGTTLTRIVISPDPQNNIWETEISWVGDSPVFRHREDGQLVLENVPQSLYIQTFLNKQPGFDPHASETNSSQLHEAGRKTPSEYLLNYLLNSFPAQDAPFFTRTIYLKPGETLLAGSDTLDALSVPAIRAELEQTEREDTETLRAIGTACLRKGDDSGLVLLRLGEVPLSKVQKREKYIADAMQFLDKTIPSSRNGQLLEQGILEIPEASAAIGSLAKNYQEPKENKDCVGAAYYPPAKRLLRRLFSPQIRYGAIVAAVTDGASSQESLPISKFVLEEAIKEENIGKEGKSFIADLIKKIAKEQPANKGSSTTLVRAVLYPTVNQDESVAEITWIGDSPDFYYDSQTKQLRILTHYENLANFLVDKTTRQKSFASEEDGNRYQNAIIEKGREAHPKYPNRASRTICYRQLCADPKLNRTLVKNLEKQLSLRPITIKIKVKKGDFFVLTSDPFEKAKIEEIKEAIEKNTTEEERVKALIKLGLIKDADDTTVAVIRVPGHKARQPYFEQEAPSENAKQAGKKRFSNIAISNLSPQEQQYLAALRTANTPSDFFFELKKFIDLINNNSPDYTVSIPFLREVLDKASSLHLNFIASLSTEDKQNFITLLYSLWDKAPIFDNQETSDVCNKLFTAAKNRLENPS